MRYDVFVSYSHTGDDLLSERVQNGLQRFAKPWWRRRALNVFRDRTALSANPGLWSSIADAIDESRYFLTLASPDAAMSAWVAREVAQWRAKHGSDNLLMVLTDGEIVWDDNANDFDWQRTTALGAAAFAGCFAEEPRHVDMRWARSEVQLDLTDGRFRDQIAELAAPVHGMAKDELAGADVRQHRRTLRHAFAAGVALVLLTLASIATSAYAVHSASAARKSAARARTEQKRADDQATLASVERLDAEHQKQVAVREAAQAQASAVVAERERRSADASAGVADRQKHLADLNAQQARANARQAQNNARQAQANLTLAQVAQLEVADKNAQLQNTNGQLSTVNGKLLTVNGQLSTVDGQLSTANGQLRSSNEALRQSNDALTAQRKRTEVQRSNAESHALAASAGIAFDQGRFDLGLLLGIEASRINPPDAQARASLLSGLRLQPTLVGHLQGLTTSVEDVAFSPDGRLLAATDISGTVDVWDTRTRGRVAQHRPPVACDVGGVALFSPDSRLVASATRCGNDIALWDPHSGVNRGDLRLANPVMGFAFDATGTRMVTSEVSPALSGLITIWDVSAARITDTMSLLPGQACLRVAFSPDGRVVACAGGEDASFGSPATGAIVQLWNTAHPVGPAVVAYPGLDANLFSLMFSADSKTLTTIASGSGVRPFIRWDVTTGHPIGAPSGPLLSPDDSSVAISPDSRYLVTENVTDQSISLRDAATGVSLGTPLRLPLGGEFGPSDAIAFTPDGRTLAAGGADGPVRLWQSDLPARLATSLPIALAPDDFVGFSPDGRIAEVTHLGSSKLVDVASGRPLPHQPSSFGSSLHGGYSAFSGDGRTFISFDNDQKIRRWDIASGQLVGRAVPVSPGCLLLAVTFDGRTAAVNCGFTGDDIKLIDLDSGRTIRDLRTTDSFVLRAAFRPDGRLLALGGANVQLWDVSSGSLAARQPDQGQGAFPTSLAFSPDGRTLGAGGALGSSLVLWDVATGQPRQTAPQGFAAPSVGNAIVVFSPDGRTVATGAMDGAVRLWDVASTQPIGPPFTRLSVINGQVQGKPASVVALAFAADGRSIVSATVAFGSDGTGPSEIVRWGLSLPGWQQQACTVANRNLTRAEWHQYFGPAVAYRKTCDGLP